MDVPDPDPTSRISESKANTVLQNAVYMEKHDVVEALLAIHANPNSRTDCQWTPLHFAAITGNNLITRKLLHYKADVNALTRANSTPLAFAMSYENIEVIKTLLAANATLSLPNPEEPTPLGSAIAGHAIIRRDSRRRYAEERKSNGK